MAYIDVKMCDLKVARSPDNLISLGIGSCVIITLYNPKLRIGALAHVMLPKSNSESNSPGQFVDTAVDEMLRKMSEMGSIKEDIEAKIVGGANMFPGNNTLHAGMDNVLSARKKLEKENIMIVRESVGGSNGRSIEFSTETGIITIKIKI